MTPDELKEVLRLHKMWQNGEAGGKRAVLRNADLSYVKLCGVNLNGADLSDADLRGAVLTNAGLCRTNLSGANLSEADMSCADLSHAGLRRTNLVDADLYDADLNNADLSEADVSGADLGFADLSGASLCYASLRGADLDRADLRGTDLRGADLSGATLGHNACFAGVKGVPVYQATCGFGSRNATLTLLAQGKREEWRWFTGCFKGSEAELRKAVREKHGDSKAGRCYLHAINYLAMQAEYNATES